MVQRAAFLHRHPDHAALGAFGCLADRLRHLARLAGAVADAALLVADDDESGEGEPPAALHHLGDAVDGDQLVDDAIIGFAVATAVAVPAAAAFSRFTCHYVSSELQPAFAGGIGQGLDPAVIK